jgi:hypothetical protein
MPSGGGRLDGHAETEGGAAQEGALDETEAPHGVDRPGDALRGD